MGRRAGWQPIAASHPLWVLWPKCLPVRWMTPIAAGPAAPPGALTPAADTWANQQPVVTIPVWPMAFAERPVLRILNVFCKTIFISLNSPNGHITQATLLVTLKQPSVFDVQALDKA